MLKKKLTSLLIVMILVSYSCQFVKAEGFNNYFYSQINSIAYDNATASINFKVYASFDAQVLTITNASPCYAFLWNDTDGDLGTWFMEDDPASSAQEWRSTVYPNVTLYYNLTYYLDVVLFLSDGTNSYAIDDFAQYKIGLHTYNYSVETVVENVTTVDVYVNRTVEVWPGLDAYLSAFVTWVQQSIGTLTTIIGIIGSIFGYELVKKKKLVD